MKNYKRDKLIASLLEQPTIAKAAAAVKITERTARTWMNDPEFMRAFRQERRRLIDGTIARLQNRSVLAGYMLVSLLRSENEAIKLGAIRTLLEYAVKGQDTAEILQRIEELEEKLQPPGTPSRNGAMKR
jgi:hypothetical protein